MIGPKGTYGSRRLKRKMKQFTKCSREEILQAKIKPGEKIVISDLSKENRG